MNKLSQQFADGIKEIMKDRNLNQSDLCNLMSTAAGYEIQRSFVNRALSGNVNLTLQSITTICSALDVEPFFQFKTKTK